MQITRRFTQAGTSPFDEFQYTKRASVLRNPDGKPIFSMEDIEVPKHWSQVATDILAQKYFRRAGVPQMDSFGTPLRDKDGNVITGPERSIRQVAHRLAGCWRAWGEEHGYFESKEDAQAFYDEIAYMILRQMAAPNSPQWFNTGIAWADGIKGTPQGHWYVDTKTGEMTRSQDAYTHPQPHACFIQSIKDDMLNEGGIFDLVTREARIFKYGSGTGTNFSALRAEGEKVSGGGAASGVMSFLKINDRAAGAVKSGGTTRRAAKMVILDIDHPDIEQFIEWKALEEQKVAALVAGSKVCDLFLNMIMKIANDGGTDRRDNHDLDIAIKKALARGVPMNYIVRCLRMVEMGYEKIDFKTFDTHYEGEAYQTVSGQNSNNSVRVTNDFMHAVLTDAEWTLKFRTSGKASKKCARKSYGRRSRFRHGPPPIRACNTIRRSTNGTPAPPMAASTRAIRAPNICFWTTRRAISRRSILHTFTMRRRARSSSTITNTLFAFGRLCSKFRCSWRSFLPAPSRRVPTIIARLVSAMPISERSS